ncbi:hypothetical protein Dimus_005860, partial [Dionaea muscipula]
YWLWCKESGCPTMIHSRDVTFDESHITIAPSNFSDSSSKSKQKVQFEVEKDLVDFFVRHPLADVVPSK